MNKRTGVCIRQPPALKIIQVQRNASRRRNVGRKQRRNLILLCRRQGTDLAGMPFSKFHAWHKSAPGRLRKMSFWGCGMVSFHNSLHLAWTSTLQPLTGNHSVEAARTSGYRLLAGLNRQGRHYADLIGIATHLVVNEPTERKTLSRADAVFRKPMAAAWDNALEPAVYAPD